MWDGKLKAVTFSYDDGVASDKRLVEIFNKYGMKATFNLNSGLMKKECGWDSKEGVRIDRLDAKEIPEIYKGHEIAVHCVTHANLINLSDEEAYKEIMDDKLALEKMFDTKVVGMAYPYGCFDDRVIEIIKKCGLKYSRTVIQTGEFGITDNLLKLEATAHHDREDLLDIVDRFVALKPDKPAMLYIWGHSYEFMCKNNWDRIEEICKRLAGHADIFYGTNSEVLLDR